MRVLDLFSGLGGWASAFRDRGHDVKTLDLEPDFNCDLTMDILDLDPEKDLKGWNPDLILASPPCNAFSVASIGHHWKGGKGAYIPKTEFAVTSQEIVKKTLEVIDQLNPSFWILENPVGMLRKQKIMDGIERSTVTYCQYGERTMKPTDLWGGYPPSLKFKPRCKNGDPCHEPAPRGSRSGIQGIKGAALRAVIPYDLSLDVCLAAEKDFENNVRYKPPTTLKDFLYS